MNSAVFKRNFPFYLFGGLLISAFLFFFVQGKLHKPAVKKKASTQQAVAASHDQEVKKFTLTGFDDKGQKFWNLQGETAKINAGQKIFLDQNVTLKLQDNTVIRTDHVEWSQDGGVMTTDAPVFVDHSTVKVKGIGAVGRPNESFIQLNRQIEMNTNQGSTLTADGPMKIYYNDNKMVLYRNVKVVDARGIVKAKRMEVLFDPQEKKAKQIICTGDVRIERDGDTTKSQRAIYTVSNGSIRLEGSPEITMKKGSTAMAQYGFSG